MNDKPIDFESLQPAKPAIINYDRKGEESLVDKAVARKIEHVTGKIAYLILQYRGALFDPWGPYINKRKDSTLKKTSEKAFNLYIRYLKTRDRSSLILAERSHHNG
jgi:hypothetical protein